MFVRDLQRQVVRLTSSLQKIETSTCGSVERRLSQPRIGEVLDICRDLAQSNRQLLSKLQKKFGLPSLPSDPKCVSPYSSLQPQKTQHFPVETSSNRENFENGIIRKPHHHHLEMDVLMRKIVPCQYPAKDISQSLLCLASQDRQQVLRALTTIRSLCHYHAEIVLSSGTLPRIIRGVLNHCEGNNLHVVKSAVIALSDIVVKMSHSMDSEIPQIFSRVFKVCMSLVLQQYFNSY